MLHRYRGHRGYGNRRGWYGPRYYGYPGLYSPLWGYGVYRPFLSPVFLVVMWIANYYFLSNE
jgi:hypothetical protein